MSQGALLDTHVLIWALSGADRLPAAMHDYLSDEGNPIYFSAATIWEVAIKFALGRPDFRRDPSELARDARGFGFSELVVTSDVASRVATLPRYHADPFDRLIVAQAQMRDLMLMTVDQALFAYRSHVRLLGPAPGRVPHP